MGLIEFFLFLFVVVLLGGLCAWAIDYFVPAHPPVVVHLVWGVAILVILVALAQATGLLHYDPPIPRFR